MLYATINVMLTKASYQADTRESVASWLPRKYSEETLKFLTSLRRHKALISGKMLNVLKDYSHLIVRESGPRRQRDEQPADDPDVQQPRALGQGAGPGRPVRLHGRRRHGPLRHPRHQARRRVPRHPGPVQLHGEAREGRGRRGHQAESEEGER